MKAPSFSPSALTCIRQAIQTLLDKGLAYRRAAGTTLPEKRTVDANPRGAM